MATKKASKKVSNGNLLDLYKKYLENKGLYISPKKDVPAFTLDQKLENANPYYVNSKSISYGR